MQGLLMAVSLMESDIGLHLRTEMFLFQSCWHRRSVDITDGRHIVFGNPLPQTQLGVKQDGAGIEHSHDGFALKGRLAVMHLCHHRNVSFTTAERHHHTDTSPDRFQ